MKNKKIPLLAVLGILGLGAVGSIAVQSFAQTSKAQVSSQSVVGIQEENDDGIVDEQDANGNDIETNDSEVNDHNDKSLNNKDDGDDEDETSVSPQPGTITESKAITIAELAYKGDGKRTQVELEMENGVLVYAVEFTESDGNEVDVKVDARTGAVIVVTSDKNENVQDDGVDQKDANGNDTEANDGPDDDE